MTGGPRGGRGARTVSRRHRWSIRRRDWSICLRVLLPEVSQPLSETPQSFPGLAAGRRGRLLDLFYLFYRQQIHACSQAVHELLSSSELLLSPFPVEGSQCRVTGRLGLGRPLTLNVATLSQSSLKGGSVVPLRGVLRSLC
jgi:hypothetical protein